MIIDYCYVRRGSYRTNLAMHARSSGAQCLAPGKVLASLGMRARTYCLWTDFDTWKARVCWHISLVQGEAFFRHGTVQPFSRARVIFCLVMIILLSRL